MPFIKENIRVILVEPRDSRNVGMAARAMANFGFHDLSIVNPPDWDLEQASVTARNAANILASARIHTCFNDAIADCHCVAGFALRDNIPTSRARNLIDISATIQQFPSRKIALVYGPEQDDLRNEHLDKCHYVVRIPTSTLYPSFNLAQSVLVSLYELTRSHNSLSTANVDTDHSLATAKDVDQLDTLIEIVMEETGFSRAGMPAAAARRIHTLLRRSNMDPAELASLMALFGKIKATLAQSHGNNDSQAINR